MSSLNNMETAPTDGTRILAADENNNTFICWWDKHFSISAKTFVFGWMSDSCVDFGGFEDPVVWMEIPDVYSVVKAKMQLGVEA